METHGAFIFLAGDKAYKMKRAVALPYMDFSTLEKRAEACRHELERNKSAAPEIYLAVESIVRSPDGKLSFNGDGEPVDWVVVMRRFDQANLFDNLARTNRLPLDLMPELAETIASYHRNAAAFPAVDGRGVMDAVVGQAVRSLVQADILKDASRTHDFANRIVADLGKLTPLLRERAARGHVRLCHGDLHLRNIVLLNGKPTLFDAIEFDDAIARIDVLYDLAFLMMDLWHRGLKAHANACFNTYASRAIPVAELDGLAALPVFLATRAAIRAMVAIDRAAVSTNDRQAALRDEITEYFDLACDFLEPCEPQLIAIGGLSGTGKTTLAAKLAPEVGLAPGALHLRSDVERKRMAGLHPLESLPASAYTERATDEVYKQLCARVDRALRAGHSVVVDATFLEQSRRRQIEDVAASNGVRFVGLWLEAPESRLIERVTQRRNDASDADASVVRHQIASHDRSTSWRIVDASGKADAVAARAMAALEHLAND